MTAMENVRRKSIDGLAVKSLEEVREEGEADPRLDDSERPTPDELDEGLVHQFVRSLSRQYSHQSHHSHRTHRTHHDDEITRTPTQHDDITCTKKDLEKGEEKRSPSISESSGEEEIIYIDWEPNDKRNPANFSRRRKWIITATASAFTGLSASAASTYAMGYPSMTRDLNCTTFQATIGLSLYALGFGIVPLITASFSEEFGRQPLYIVSTLIFALMHVAVALSNNIQSVLIFRFIAGAAGSTGSTMVGGTVADIWAPAERGVPMCLFSVAAIGATGLGPVFAGWIELNPNLEWRWIQWMHAIVTGIFLVLTIVLMTETRSAVLLTKLARKLRKKTGDHRYRARAEDERASLRTLIKISCTRPIYLLFTEPVVASFSLWIGFAWGILYALIESIAPAFQTLHGFNQGETGSVFVTFTIASFLGLASSCYQERLYKKYQPTKHQEARLYSALYAAVLFPVGMFIYAWTAYSSVPWIAMAIGITIFIWSLFIMYLAVFTYLADCYGPFASSALAGQSLSRNIAGTLFPLFTQQMYARLTYQWSGTLFGCLAILMAPIPFILYRWGPAIRARSKFASQVPNFGS